MRERREHWNRAHIPRLTTWLVTMGFAMGALTAAAVNAGSSASTPPVPETGAAVPATKQTTLGLYVTAREAYERWRAAPATVKVIDVRTPEEYMWVGHAPMAWLIPVLAVTYEWDAQARQFPARPLPDFVERVRKVASPQDTLMVMCRSGGRGAAAVNLLAQAGYKHVYNVTDGMEGDAVEDPNSVFHGQHLVNGWKNSALPWTYKVDPARLVLPATP